MISVEIKDCYSWTNLFTTNCDSFTKVYMYIVKRKYHKIKGGFTLPIFIEDSKCDYIHAESGEVVEEIPDMCIIISEACDPLEGE